MPSRPTPISRIAFVVMAAWTITTITVIASIVLLLLGRPQPLPNDVLAGVGGLSFALLAFAFASVGAMVVLRVPANAVGWIFVAGGLLTGLGLLADQYAAYVLTRGSSAPVVAYAAWLATPATQAMAALLGLTLLLFPDGRLPSARWRRAAAVGWLAAVLLVGAPALRSGSLEDPFPTVVNPLGIPGTHGALKTAEGIGWLLAIAGMAVGAAAAVTRLRRARDDERQQLKLVFTAGAVVAAVATLDMVGWLLWPHGHLQLRIAVIGLSFTAVAIAFRPLRRALQDGVDRRFSRARYEALRSVEAFLEDLRAGRAAPEEIEGLLRELLADPTLEVHFFLPESALCVNAAGTLVAGPPGDDRVNSPIERAGALVALIIHRPGGPRQSQLLAQLVTAGGLAFEIARLRVELRRQLAEVEASRARILAAGYLERRRIERDLHDGAQQRLVSVGLQLRHAQFEIGRVPDEQTEAAVDHAVAELSLAIGELRELAHGLPPAQLDAGLEPAFCALAGRTPLSVQVHTTHERFAVELEAAAYFVACEGLTNAIKHARATGVVLAAYRHDERLVVSVSDDGIGGAVAAGSGLSGLLDRVAAHGGSLHIASDPGVGTTLTAELPCGS